MSNSLESFTEKQRALIELLFTPECGGDPYKAMRAAGYSDTTHFKQILTEPMRQMILVQAQQYLVENSSKAAYKLVNVLENPSDIGSDKIIQAAKEVLDRTGLVKVEKHRHDIHAEGIILLPIKDLPVDATTITLEAKEI